VPSVVEAMLARASAAGVSLEVYGDNIRWRAPDGLPDDLRTFLSKNKRECLAAIRHRAVVEEEGPECVQEKVVEIARVAAVMPPKDRSPAPGSMAVISSGLLMEDTDLTTVDYYASLGPVIVQFFEDQDERRVPIANGVVIARTKRPTVSSGWPPHWQRFAYQVAGVKAALERCDAEYVIRVRNDEHVTNLLPMVDKFLANKRRLVSANILWSKEYRTHVGDHVFMGETSLLLEAYEVLWGRVIAGTPLSVKHPSPECELFKAFVVASRKKYPSSKEKEMVLDRADVVPIHQLGDYKVMNHRDDRTFAWTQNNPCPYNLVVDSAELSGIPIVLGDEPCRPA